MSNAEYCLFWIDSWLTCSTKGEWAAWIGAVVTAVAGVLVVNWQYRKQQRLSRDADRRRIKGLIELLDQALGWIETVRVVPKYPDDVWGANEVRFFGPRATALRRMLDALSDTEPRELPTIDLRLRVRRAREAIQSVADLCSTMELYSMRQSRPSIEEFQSFRNQVPNDEDQVAATRKALLDHLEGR